MKKVVIAAFFLLTAFYGWSQRVINQCVGDGSGTRVEMTTNYGKILLLLYDDTPGHRDNFIKLTEEGVYKGLLFHRVIERFMIQGGDPDSREAKPGQMLGNGTLGYTIPAEIVPGRFHKRGALCAARTGDNVNPRRESSSCQFYIVQGQVWSNADLDVMEQRFGRKISPEQRKVYSSVGGAPHLDGSYTVFGEVIEGMDVVDKIAAVKRDINDRPVEDVVILSMKLMNK